MSRVRRLQIQALAVLTMGAASLIVPTRAQARTPGVCGPWCSDGCGTFDCQGCPSAPGTRCVEFGCGGGQALIYCVTES
jgi:hypothetical protein